MENSSLQEYFSRFRQHIIGIDQMFDTPHGIRKIIYADSGDGFAEAAARAARMLRDELVAAQRMASERSAI